MNRIKMLVMDVDGTLTDGSIHISNSGELFKTFDVKDGMGIQKLHQAGIITVIMTGRESEIVNMRAAELKIDEVVQGVTNKLVALEQILSKYHFGLENVAYIGDDVNDYEVITKVGLSFCPSNAVIEIVNCVDIVLNKEGGHGAVRECCDRIILLNNDST